MPVNMDKLVSLDRAKEIKTAENGMIATVEASSTASKAYAVGDYFYYTGKLYKATAAIASGGTITVGTNCALAKLGDDVGALKSAIKDVGALTVYSSSTAECKLYFQVAANVPIVFRPISSASSGTRMNIYGINNDDTNTLLIGQVAQGKTEVVTPASSFKGIRVITSPYNDTPFSFGFVQDANGLEYRVDILQNKAAVAETAFRPYGNSVINSGNYSTYFTDANLAPKGCSFCIASNVTEQMISHLPVYGTLGVLFTLNSLSIQNHGLIQLYSNESGKLWYRFESGSESTYTYTDWYCINDVDASIKNVADTAKADADALSNILFCGHYKSNASGNIVADYTSISQGDVYRVYAWNVTGMLANNPVVYLIANDNTATNMSSAKTAYDNGFYWEITIPASTKSLRFYANKAGTADYAECDYAIVKFQGTMIDFIHDRLSTKEDKMSLFNRTTCKIFKKVVCCGDSYTAGYVNIGGVVDSVNEEFAWPHYMATLTGNEYVNCGASGTNVLTWQTNARGLAAAQTAGLAQAYIIGLMINDQGETAHVDVGTIDDIGTENETYYAGMSKIIRELNAISETAKIFVLTCPNTASSYAPYNQAVRDIVEAYAETYPVHLIDLYAMRNLFSNASLTGDFIGGHYTAVGYEQFAEIMSYAISDYINHHVSDFQNIHKIPYGNS